MPARYFQGETVTGPVKESDAKTFADVVDHLRIAPVLGITRAAFLALDKKRRNEIKQVPFFVPATFKEATSKRSTEHAVHCNLIFLDIDELPDGRCPAAPFVRNPALLEQALDGFNFAAHVTASSTPQKPRMRVIVDAEAIPLIEYPRAVATIGALLGLPAITKESSVAVQPMFLPTLFQDDPQDASVLLAHNIDGRHFAHSDISDSLDSYNGTNGKNGSHANGSKPHGVGTADSIDALEFCKAPVEGITLRIVKEALGTIDPDCVRDEWIATASALRHQFSPHQDDEAYTLFDEWSAQGSKYVSSDETLATWRSVKHSPVGRLPITIRSLFKRATDAGWDNKVVKENLFTKMVKWLEDAPDVVTLMEQGIRKIIATPLLTSMQEDVLVNNLSTQAKKRFCYSVSVTAIRKDLNKAKGELNAAQQGTKSKDEKVPSWAQGILYIEAPDEFYRHRTGEKFKAQAFNATYSRWLMNTTKDLLAQGLPVNEATLSTPKVAPSLFALNNLRIPKAYDYAYCPSKPASVWFVNNGTKYVNTYIPTYPSLDPSKAQFCGELLLRHLGNLIGEEPYRRHLIDWLAFQVQFPGRKIRHAVLVQSAEGAGKTFLAEAMKVVLGAEHVKTIDGGSISSGWNEWCFGRQLIVIEEVKVDGTNKHEVMNSLKPLITNDYISVNEKFRNNREVQNISNYMLFSNHHDALALTPNDRRYFVIKSPLQTKEQVLALGDDYFAPLFAMLRDHPGGLRSFLMDWTISPGFDADGHAPRTIYVSDMVSDSASELTAAVRRLLIEGDYPLVQHDIVSASVLKTALHENEGLTRVTAQRIAQVLREEGMIQAGRHLIGDERHYVWMRAGMVEADVVGIATERQKKGLKNLGMNDVF